MTMLNLLKMLILVGLVVGMLIALIYFTLIRPWILSRGTTRQDVNLAMPGDGLVINPNTKYTQAITIKAPVEIIWAYLIQVGYQRAGWYNWDFINRMASKEYFYEGNKSALRIIPELQNLKQGDRLHILPQIGFDVAELKENEIMLLTGYENGRYVVVWSFLVKKTDKNTSRLYVRWSSRIGEGFMFNVMNYLFTEPGGAGVQQWQMLQGIKKRAEREMRKNK